MTATQSPNRKTCPGFVVFAALSLHPDQALPPDQALSPDQALLPDQALPPDQALLPDQALPPDHVLQPGSAGTYLQASGTTRYNAALTFVYGLEGQQGSEPCNDEVGAYRTKVTAVVAEDLFVEQHYLIFFQGKVAAWLSIQWHRTSCTISLY